MLTVMSEIMYCPKCGKKLSISDTFCESCGTKIKKREKSALVSDAAREEMREYRERTEITKEAKEKQKPIVDREGKLYGCFWFLWIVIWPIRALLNVCMQERMESIRFGRGYGVKERKKKRPKGDF